MGHSSSSPRVLQHGRPNAAGREVRRRGSHCAAVDVVQSCNAVRAGGATMAKAMVADVVQPCSICVKAGVVPPKQLVFLGSSAAGR